MPEHESITRISCGRGHEQCTLVALLDHTPTYRWRHAFRLASQAPIQTYSLVLEHDILKLDVPEARVADGERALQRAVTLANSLAGLDVAC